MDEDQTPLGHDPGDGGRRVRPVDLRDYVDPVPGAATRVRVFGTSNLAQDIWCVEPHCGTEALHHPDRDVAYTVIAGRARFVTDDGEVGLDPMGALLVPAGIVHGFENRGPDPLIVIAVASPPGADDEHRPAEPAGEAVHHPQERPRRVRRAVEAVLGTSRPQR